jgi:hypothetical protein
MRVFGHWGGSFHMSACTITVPGKDVLGNSWRGRRKARS